MVVVLVMVVVVLRRLLGVVDGEEGLEVRDDAQGPFQLRGGPRPLPLAQQLPALFRSLVGWSMRASSGQSGGGGGRRVDPDRFARM